MGYKTISLKMPTGYDDGRLRKKIEHLFHIDDFNFSIVNKSLDARNKSNINWELRVMVSSDAFKTEKPFVPELQISNKKRGKKVTVIGSGPAGFFSAFVLQKAGFNVTLIERGTDVKKRTIDIDNFEKTGDFTSNSNYSFGEGGAGTFSDGKLTSRSKKISLEKRFILQSYVDAGAPEEILYMTHPHVGSDNLKIIVRNLRRQFTDLGGTVLFETTMTDFNSVDGNVKSVITDKGTHDSEYLLIAPGHSSYDTYRLMMNNGVQFRNKNFAIGSRMEHYQEVINVAQWGKKSLPGVKAAEYRLTSKGQNREQVYSFCMCPGGIIVPAGATPESNIVNGMSNYQRENEFANAACVATVDINRLLNKEVSPMETLDWMEKLENSFYKFSGGYKAPFCSIKDFISGKTSSSFVDTSYPLGIIQAPLWELLPN